VARLRDELEKTYRSHRQGLFSLALSITGCRQLAEDAVHSAFERLCRLTVAPKSDLTNYVFASVRNAARDVQRTKHRVAKVHESFFADFVDSGSKAAVPADNLLTAERDQILRDAVNELEDDVREVVVLKIFAGLTFEAIGNVMELPSKTVATRYRRAILKLEERLRGQI